MPFYFKGFKRHFAALFNSWIGEFVVSFLWCHEQANFHEKNNIKFSWILKTNLGMSLVCLFIIVFVLKTIWTVQKMNGNSWKFRICFFVKTSGEQLISCKKWTQFWSHGRPISKTTNFIICQEVQSDRLCYFPQQ